MQYNVYTVTPGLKTRYLIYEVKASSLESALSLVDEVLEGKKHGCVVIRQHPPVPLLDGTLIEQLKPQVMWQLRANELRRFYA